MDAEAMAKDIVSDYTLLLELRNEVARSPADPEDAVHLHRPRARFLPTFLVVPTAARTQQPNHAM